MNQLPFSPPIFPGIDGFLGSRASFGMDLVMVVLIALLPVLTWSIYLVHYRQAY